MKKDNLNYKGFSRIFLDFDDHPQHEFDKLMSSFFLSVLRLDITKSLINKIK